MHTIQELTEFIKVNITSLALLCAFAQSNAISIPVLVVLIVGTYVLKTILARYEDAASRNVWLLVFRTYKLLLDFTIYYFTYMFARKISIFMTYLTNSDSVSDFLSLISPILFMVLLVSFITLIEYATGITIPLPSDGGRPPSKGINAAGLLSLSNGTAPQLATSDSQIVHTNGSTGGV